MKIQSILPAIVLAMLLCLQTSFDLAAQDRQIDDSHNTGLNQRHEETTEQTNTDINTPIATPGGGLGGSINNGHNTNDENDHYDNNGVENETSTESITCSKPEFVFSMSCSTPYTTVVEWTQVENCDSYDLLFVSTDISNGHSERIPVPNYTNNTYDLVNLLDLPGVRNTDLSITGDPENPMIPALIYVIPGYKLEIYITPIFQGTCNTIRNDYILFGIFQDFTITCEIDEDGNHARTDNDDICCSGAKGFAALDGGGKTATKNILPSSTLLITPNPVQNNANITVDLPESNSLSINIYGTNGQHIQEIIANNHMNKGLHNFNYDTSHLPTGIYYCQVQSGGKFITKKIVKMD